MGLLFAIQEMSLNECEDAKRRHKAHFRKFMEAMNGKKGRHNIFRDIGTIHTEDSHATEKIYRHGRKLRDAEKKLS